MKHDPRDLVEAALGVIVIFALTILFYAATP